MLVAALEEIGLQAPVHLAEELAVVEAEKELRLLLLEAQTLAAVVVQGLLPQQMAVRQAAPAS
jgi:hypothetical protein